MRRGPIPKWQPKPSFHFPSCEEKSYPVLAPVSRSYPDLRGRLPTCYSPVRRWLQGASSHPSARLACIRHAASVRPEPGSNSPKSVWLLICFYIKWRASYNRSLILKRWRFYWFCSVFKDQCPHCHFRQLNNYIIPSNESQYFLSKLLFQ